MLYQGSPRLAVPVKAALDPEPIPEPAPEGVEVPEPYGHEDGHEGHIVTVIVMTVIVMTVIVTDPEGPILVPTIPVPVAGKCWRNDHGYYD
jgi:hypothetical protein